MGRNSVYQFESEGVTAYLHYQKPALVVKRIEAIEQDTPKDSEFQPKRLVINIVATKVDEPNAYIKEFVTPLELHVRFTPCDVMRAREAGYDEPVLAYWDGTTWVPFTDKHEFTLYYGPDCESGGVGVVKIQHWGDPEIAWGP